MLLHPKSSVTFRRKYNSFSQGGKSLHGITKVLAKVFYPQYDFFKAKTDHSKNPNPAKAYKKIKGSQRLGRGFDTCVGTFVRLRRRYPWITPLTIVSPQKHLLPYEGRMTQPDFRTAMRLVRRKNPYLRMLLSLCHKQKLLPVADQVAVGHIGLKLATNADLVLYDQKNKKFRPVELKTGFDGYLKKSTDFKMTWPFDKQHDYPLNQHFLQLAETTELYKYTFPQLNVGESMLLVFQSEGVEEFSLPKFLRNKQILRNMQQMLMAETG